MLKLTEIAEFAFQVLAAVALSVLAGIAVFEPALKTLFAHILR